METAQLNVWLGRWRQGDDQAREALLGAAYPRLEVLARKMLQRFPNIRPLNDTQDVLQNAVMRLMRSLRQVDPPPATTREFFGLAATEIRRELLDLARSAASIRRGGKADRDDLKDDLPQAGAAPVDLERWTAFHEAVEQLPAEEREVVGLRFYHGWTIRQVAELFGVTERTAARYWHSACLRLQMLLQDQLPCD